MGLLDEPGLDRVLDAGCTKCGARQLTFASYVDGLLPIMGGEPVGKLTWVYDGEKSFFTQWYIFGTMDDEGLEQSKALAQAAADKL